MWKFVKMWIGLLLWPLAYAATVATYTLHQRSVVDTLDAGWGAWALPAGFLLWVLIFFILPRPFRTYVLGHELTHALWALMMGARVGKMKVGKTGGHVELSKTNFAITLAPYFFPFYTTIVIAIYCIAGRWMDTSTHQGWWLAAVGLTWSFHITFTLHMLSQHQPDVQEHGRIFSFTVIYIMNVLVIALMMVLLGTPRFLEFGNLLGHKIAVAYNYTYQYLMRGWFAVAEWIGSLK